MKRSDGGRRQDALLAMACPLLILLALAAFLQRPGADRVQALPALAIGCGLVSLRVIRRRRRRRELLDALRLHR